MALSRTRRPGTAGLLTQEPGPVRHGLILTVLPLLLMGAVFAVCVLAGPTEGFIPMLSLGPALASVSRRAVQTALTGVLALALAGALTVYDGVLGGHRAVIAFVTIGGVTAAGVVASAIRQRQERELTQVRAVAEVAQQVLLRPLPSHTPPLEMAVRYVSASAAARIGGDLYEVISTPHGVRFILGDVQGKGLQGVRTAAVVLGAFREAAFDALDLEEIAARIELSLRHQAAEEEFVTVILGQADTGGPSVEILNCGHPPPLLLRDGIAAPVEDPDPSLPLGLASLAPSPAAAKRTPMTVPFGAGDQMLFYTDGVSEARDKTGVFYPLSRCGALLAAGDPDAALARLQDDVTRYVGHALEDDAAMLLIRSARHGAPEDLTSAGQVPARM
ncbi:MAG TPA: PP2C family protein-serine/threonine phosphatase [Trebonia sp.]|jgi:serine phosphatase RsbU (regulator of sigma subunit)